MSKRVLILLLIGILAIVASIFLLKYELTKSEQEQEGYPDQEQEREQEQVNGPRKGYYYDRKAKKWLKCKSKPESESQPGAQKEGADSITGKEIIEPDPLK